MKIVTFILHIVLGVEPGALHMTDKHPTTPILYYILENYYRNPKFFNTQLLILNKKSITKVEGENKIYGDKNLTHEIIINYL